VFLPRLFRETNLRLSPVNPPDLRHCIRVEQVCALGMGGQELDSCSRKSKSPTSARREKPG
jgi:hypothetical protein